MVSYLPTTVVLVSDVAYIFAMHIDPSSPYNWNLDSYEGFKNENLLLYHISHYNSNEMQAFRHLGKENLPSLLYQS